MDTEDTHTHGFHAFSVFLKGVTRVEPGSSLTLLARAVQRAASTPDSSVTNPEDLE